MKLAVTVAFAVRVREHVDVPLQTPPQPANVEPVAAAAVRVTAVPLGKFAEHVWPQLTPAGELVTVPDPVPAFETASCTGGAVAVLNVAETEVSAAIVTLQVPVPLHDPPQPLNVIPFAAVAVRVTVVPA